MKKIFAIIFLTAAVSCNTGRYIESRESEKNSSYHFTKLKKVDCTMDIEKRIGRQLSVQ